MTGELADCFSNKRLGILSIKEAVEESFSCPIKFWGVDGFRWTDVSDLAAANWSASASLISKEIGDCLFADMGSTTTDLIPIKSRPKAGRTDFNRLANGELIYSGLLRTNLAFLLHEVNLAGRRIPLSSELFAISADAHLVLGEIAEAEYAVEPPMATEKIESLPKGGLPGPSARTSRRSAPRGSRRSPARRSPARRDY